MRKAILNVDKKTILINNFKMNLFKVFIFICLSFSIYSQDRKLKSFKDFDRSMKIGGFILTDGQDISLSHHSGIKKLISRTGIKMGMDNHFSSYNE